MWEWIGKYWLEVLFGAVSTLLLGLWQALARRMKKTKVEQDAIRAGLQALLRAQIIDMYERYSEKGFAPIYVRDSFENVYKQYEKLGENGVINDIHTKFLALPTR